MNKHSVFFIGTDREVAHHAAPLIKVFENDPVDVKIIAPEPAMDQIGPGSLAIFYSEHFDAARICCERLKQKGVATLYMIDGILEWRNAWENRAEEPACPWTMRQVLSHKVACIGPSQARVLASWGNGPQIEVTGIPRFDSLVESWKLSRESKSDHADPANQPAQDNVTEPRSFRILAMTAKFPGFTPEQVETARCSLVDLKEFVENNPVIDGRPVEIIWRLTRNMDQAVGVENRLSDLTGADLATTLGNVDAVVTTPSTAMLESMLMGKPVALLEYNRNPHYVPAAWHIGSKADIGRVLAELISPPARRIHYQNHVLQDALLIGNGPLGESTATNRLATLIRGMLDIAGRQIEQDQQVLTFPAAMLEPVEPVPALFFHNEIYAGYAGFDTSDTLKLQTSEANARRVINSLRADINQLESKLAEAYGYFDQINNHPIAGPVVRTRQKLIDWMGRFKSRHDENNTR